jgi:hypothetical protein
LDTPVPNNRETNFSSLPRSFGPRQGDRTGGGLHRGRAIPVARARPRIRHLATTLVAGPAEELLHLGLYRGLHDQTGAQPGDVFEDLAQLAAGAEQRVDLATDLLCRGYS